jgi:hypothetical protein
MAHVTIKKTVLITLVFIAISFLPALAQACPGCANALNGTVGRGLNASILFMMAMPFTVVGTVAAGIFIAYRRARNIANPATEPGMKAEQTATL